MKIVSPYRMNPNENSVPLHKLIHTKIRTPYICHDIWNFDILQRMESLTKKNGPTSAHFATCDNSAMIRRRKMRILRLMMRLIINL